MKDNRVFKAGIGYTIGNILIKGVSFITLPIFTRLMSTAEYGLYSTYVSYESILSILVGLGLHASLKMANIDFKGKINEYVSTVLMLPIVVVTFAFIAFLPFADIVTELLGFPFIILLIMLINAWSSSVINVYNGKISLEYAYERYLRISLISAISNVGLSLLFILTVSREDAFFGRVLGTSIPIFIIAILILRSFIKCEKPRFKKGYIKFGISYSLPLIPHGISQLILSQFGKIVIQRKIGNTAAGIYGFAYTIVMIPQILSTSLDTVWGPWFFEQYDKGEKKLIEKRASEYVALFSSITCILCCISPEIVKVLGHKSYWDASLIVIPAILGAYFAFLYTIPAQMEYFHKKTKYVAIGTIIAAISNVVLSILLIPKYGYEISVYITLLTYVVYFIAHMLIAYKIENKMLPLNIRELLVYIILVCAVSIIMQTFKGEWMLRYAVLFVVLCILIMVNKGAIKQIVSNLKK